MKKMKKQKKINCHLIKSLAMGMQSACKHMISCLLIASLFSVPVAAEDTKFRRVLLDYDISIEIPSHWKVISEETRKNLGVFGEAIRKNANIEGPGGNKITLLAVNATPDPTGAMVRVSVTSRPDYTQADLITVTPDDLKSVEVELQNSSKKLEASGGPKIIEIQPVRIDKLNGYQALVMSYIRSGINEPSPWQVTQYKSPVSDRLVEITLSYRQSDGILWRPILEHVKRSLKF
jgi:hypothetical protein